MCNAYKVYGWPQPEETLEGEAANAIEALQARVAKLDALLPPCRALARCCDPDAETHAIIRICEAIEAYDAALQETGT